MDLSTRLAPALLVCLALAGCEPRGPAPSIVLVSWDTVRRDHCSLYGYERETTPFLEELARESVVYENAYTTASFTLTAHMSMLSGLYPSQHGVGKHSALSPEVPTLAERLRRRGYHNVAVHRGGWIDERYGYDRGFDVFEVAADGAEVGRTMRAALRDRPRERPLFLFLHVFDAHCQSLDSPRSTVYVPPPEYEDLFRAGAAQRLRQRPARELYSGAGPRSPEEAEDLIALYDASIRRLDDCLREWVDVWRAEGILDDALVVVTSDHGEALGQHGGEWDTHGGFWQEGLRVPLLVRYPGGRGGGTRDERLGSAVDLVPTVLDVLGIEPEPWLPGLSLAAPSAAREVILAERYNHLAILDGKRKTRVSKRSSAHVVFDLARDPGELEPLQEGAAEIHRQLEASARRLLAVPPPGAPIRAGRPSKAEQSELSALGYAGEDG